MTRYVELIKQNRPEHVEAPGKPVDKAPLSAPFSDANRRAATPEPNGPEPTASPGDGVGRYQRLPKPGMRGPEVANLPQTEEQQQPTPDQIAMPQAAAPPPVDSDRFAYREPVVNRAAASVNWNTAIKEVGKIASLGGGDGIDLDQMQQGGEKGYAEAGPLSFETRWYDWGEYAQSMVSRIRVNWYANMPQIIRTGMQGVATIRFTINRDGRISDITILNSSGVPPYDFAARKAIELSSPLNPLPKDFPNPSERVTAMFYYNKKIE